MEIKDLIRELRAIYTCSLKEADVRGYDLEKYDETFNQVESTVIKLEKYKQIFEELEDIRGAIEWEMVDFEEIKERYFPKPKKTITIEIKGNDIINLSLATIMMKSALDNWDFKKEITFKTKGGIKCL